MSAVIVNFNAGHLLQACVDSLWAEGVAEIVVADNASRDGSAARLAAADSRAQILPTGGNLGFGRGANRGAVRTTEPLVLVGNPDIKLQDGALGALVAALDRDPGLALVAPQIVNTDGSTYPSPRTFPNLVDAAGHAFLGVISPHNRFTRRYRLLDIDRQEASNDVEWVSGSCFLIRRSAWDQLGGFDEAYFMYAEDVDLCWRARRLGWRIGYEPAAVVTHVQGASTSQVPYRMILEHHRSLLRFSARSLRGGQRLLLPLVAAGLALRVLLAWAERAVRGRRTR